MSTSTTATDYGTHVIGSFAGLDTQSGSAYTTIFVRTSDHPRYGLIELSSRADSDISKILSEVPTGTEISIKVAAPYVATSKRTGNKYLGGFYPLTVELLAE